MERIEGGADAQKKFVYNYMYVIRMLKYCNTLRVKYIVHVLYITCKHAHQVSVQVTLSAIIIIYNYNNITHTYMFSAAILVSAFQFVGSVNPAVPLIEWTHHYHIKLP